MLTQLYIQNIAVIQKASIQLGPGLNVFTGETGAGKTILISAIDAVLGERTSRDIIRTGEEKATVSALFEDISSHAKNTLENLGYSEEDGSVLITREITAAGKNTCKINGMPATVSILKELSSTLIHIHGQRDSTQLLEQQRHMEMVDVYGDLNEALAVYRQSYRKLRDFQEQLSALQMDESQKAQRMDMLQFQVDEIEAARLEDPQEEETLLARKKMITGSEKILSGLAEGYEALSGGEEGRGIQELLNVLVENVSSVALYMDEFSTMAKRLEEISYEISDFSIEMRDALDHFEFDPRELDEIEQRLDIIYRLKRKYGSSLEEIMDFYNQINEELAAISTSEAREKELQKSLEEVEVKAIALAQSISEKRLSAAAGFVSEVEAQLTFLDMPSVKLSIAHSIQPLSSSGMDGLEFMISTNVGEEPKPLSKIASGGEISRIMLAIKNVLAEKDDVGTLIFDEVDTGVSGRAAGKIGAKLSSASESRQVICVTHLAQVAAFGDNHLLIEKQVEQGRTSTQVKQLSKDEAIRELARITSGEVITDASLQSALELWERAHQK